MSWHMYYWIDAFSEIRFAGNPCVVVLDADHLSSDTMLTIAKEMNLSETAFVTRSSKADFGARYFTPAEEIPLAGHPTIATIHALIEAGRIKLEKEITKLSLELKAGVVSIEIQKNSKSIITMSQNKPEFLSVHSRDQVAQLFGLCGGDLFPEVPVQTVSTGTPQLMVPVRDLIALKKAQVNISNLISYKQVSDFFSSHLFCLEGISPEEKTFARHFSVPPEQIEDAFTGSATGAMAAYLWRYNLISSPQFIAEQGHGMGRPGKAYVEVIESNKSIETIKVGGSAVTVMQGKIQI